MEIWEGLLKKIIVHRKESNKIMDYLRNFTKFWSSYNIHAINANVSKGAENNCTNIQEIFYNKNYTISIIEIAISN